MLIYCLLKGIMAGFLATMPIGPISLLIIQRTSNKNRQAGFYSGIGAAFSDIFYASITYLGLSIIIGYIQQHECWFRLAGVIILSITGIFIFLSHPEKHKRKRQNKINTPVGYIFSSFLLTISNPLIIFWYLAIFSGFKIIPEQKNLTDTILVLSGFLTGDILWWFLLTKLLTHLQSRFTPKVLLFVNRISGAGIILFAIALYLQTFRLSF